MSIRTQNQAAENRIQLEDFEGKKLFFCGIGGSSMSGLAQICQAQGYQVSGSDRSASPFTQALARDGIAFQVGQRPENVHGADLFIYSAAIPPTHVERAEATRLGIPQMERSVLLGKISARYDEVVAIAGGHGKTTTSSMLALICMEAGLDPTVHIGGMVPFLGGGVRVGHSQLFITEACEYVESFMTLHPSVVSINNIDDDHLDYFRDIDHITQTFSRFVDLLPAGGPLFGCADDARVRTLMEEKKRPGASFGLRAGDYRAENLRPTPAGGQIFSLTLHAKPLYDVTLTMPGQHNVLDALCAIAIARHLGAADEHIVSALASYTLTGRRFEYMGQSQGAAIYHDYAHHPTEITACLQGARSLCQGKLYTVLQCNSYTRAKTLFTGDVRCFGDADEVLVPDIYPGREVDTGLVHARDMVSAIQAGGAQAQYLPTFEEIDQYLCQVLGEKDMVVTLGSGDVYQQTQKLLHNAPHVR